MRYIVIGAIILVVSLLVSKVLMAVNLVHFNKYNVVKSENKPQEIDNELLQTGKSNYLVYCSSCHGKDGKGNKDKAQDHTKRMAKKSILDVIENGANNFVDMYPSGMPAGLVNKEDAKELAAYVANGLVGEKPKAWATCASCHDESGEGIAYVAPNIKNYSDELVATVLHNGKKGVIGTMPSFDGRLTDLQIKALAAHIRSLGQ